MLKIRLKKDKETLYGINIGLAIFTLISLGILIYQYFQGNNTTIGGIRLFLLVHLILQIIFSLFWLPYVIKRKMALKRGREVECQITAIKSKKRNFKSALRNLQFNYMYQDVYYIKVKYELDGNKKLSVLDDYGDDPSDYLPYDYRQRKYKLYIYRNELFLQELFLQSESERDVLKNEKFLKKLQAQPIDPKHKKELEARIKKNRLIRTKVLNGKYDNTPIEELIKYPLKTIKNLDLKTFNDAVDERKVYCFISSSEYVVTRPIYFRTIYSKYEVFIEIQMSSENPYTYASFEFSINVKEYLNMIGNTYTEDMEEEVIMQIYRIVRRDILKEDVNIIIKKIDIVICKYPEKDKDNNELNVENSEL